MNQLLSFILLSVMLTVIVVEGVPWSIFDSSRSNAEMAEKNYPNDGFQRWFARSFGDEIPSMRDDIIRRKNNGEGAIRRHMNSWSDWDNWSVDSNNDRNERMDPDLD